MPSVCLGYIVANEEPLLNLSLHTMLPYDWVRCVIVLNTVVDRAATLLHDKILYYGRNYGHGFTKSVKTGGFDEVTARNNLLHHMQMQARSFGCDWLLLCDADEYYTNDFAPVLDRAKAAGKLLTLVECWSPCSADDYVYFPKLHHDHYGPMMNDPHPRALRTECPRRFEFNPWLHHSFINRTIHCLIRAPLSEMHVEQNYCHVHTKFLFKASTEGEEVRPLPTPLHWPDVYQQAWDREWSSSQGYGDRYPLPIVSLQIQ